MILFHPRALWWGLLALPIIGFYLWRFRHPRLPVAAGWLWQQALAAAPHGRAWRPWRGPLSLLLELLLLALLVWALADPHRPLSLTPLAQRPSYAAAEAGQMAAAISRQAQRPDALGEAPAIWPWLLAAAVLLLVVEWGLYQRRWTS